MSEQVPVQKREEGQVARFLGGRPFEDAFADYERDGYLIFENVLPPEKIQEVRAALAAYLAGDVTGRNDFEGMKSNRIYALLDKHPVFAELATHPLALAFVERELGPSCLLSACLAINLHPDETVQPWHYDDAHIDIPRPRPAYGVSTFWAIDAMTDTNGATEIIPGSHRWGGEDLNGDASKAYFQDNTVRDVSDDPSAREDTVKVTMPSGSFMVAKGTLWHRGGANKSDAPRLIVTPQYCPGWARPLESMALAVSRENARKLPRRAQELLGYSIHPPFMGYMNGVHPKKALEG